MNQGWLSCCWRALHIDQSDSTEVALAARCTRCTLHSTGLLLRNLYEANVLQSASIRVAAELPQAYQIGLTTPSFYRSQMVLALLIGTLFIAAPAAILEAPAPTFTAQTLLRRVVGIDVAVLLSTAQWVLLEASERDRLYASTFRKLNFTVSAATVVVRLQDSSCCRQTVCFEAPELMCSELHVCLLSPQPHVCHLGCACTTSCCQLRTIFVMLPVQVGVAAGSLLRETGYPQFVPFTGVVAVPALFNLFMALVTHSRQKATE